MATDPFDVLARTAGAKSDLRLEQAVVASVASGRTATVTMRGGDVPGIEFTGTPPAIGTRVWLLVDKGTVLGLAGGVDEGGVPGAPPMLVVDFPVPSATWVIDVGADVDVVVLDSAGRVVWPGEILYGAGTGITLKFSAAFSGKAYCYF